MFGQDLSDAADQIENQAPVDNAPVPPEPGADSTDIQPHTHTHAHGPPRPHRTPPRSHRHAAATVAADDAAVVDVSLQPDAADSLTDSIGGSALDEVPTVSLP